MGLGPLRHVSLAEARKLADEARRQRRLGQDPIEVRRGEKLARRQATTLTFRQCAEGYLKAHASSWRSAAHAKQWPATLETYCYPVFGDLAITALDTGLVMRVLEPLWQTKPETASRVRGRIELILSWAMAHGHRLKGENPAQWRGHLENLLPKLAKAKQAARRASGDSAHFAALPYAKLGGFMAVVRAQDSVSAKALAFAILTAARSGEALNMRWSEVDLVERMWTIPAERMKAHKEHRVPLSAPALKVLAEMDGIRSGEFVFPGIAANQPLGRNALDRQLRRLNDQARWGEVTVHGFRSTFSDWVAERTAYPSEVREMALAHAVGDKVEAAYRRGELLEKRRALSEAWGDFCGQPDAPATGKVVAFNAA
jgi:integrase